MSLPSKLVVLDANAFWTEQLFRQAARFADVLLLKPRDFRAHKKSSGTIRSDSVPRAAGYRMWEQRLSMPMGWMVELWRWSHRRIAHVIRDFCGNAQFTLVITYPQYRSLISALKPDLSVYYNMDEYSGNWPRHRARVPFWEAETVNAADITICIAAHRVKVLAERDPVTRHRLHHLPIGCTPQFMANQCDSVRRWSIPALESLSHPLAGYIGALNFRFDFTLLADVATRLREVTFVLAGQPQQDGDAVWRLGLRRACAMSNIHFLGWIDHSKLGHYINELDVLLIPYTKCHFNTNACPAKLWDYLGTGKPIVATDANPETLLWREVVSVAKSAEEFAELVRDSLAKPESALRKRRLEIATAHTWDKLNSRLEHILESSSATIPKVRLTKGPDWNAASHT